MRLIYVTAGFPYPLTSGYLRHFHLLQRLAREHEIRLFSLVGRDHGPDDRAVVEALGIDVVTVPVDSTAPRRVARKVSRLARRATLGGARELRTAVAACVDEGWADAAVVTGKTTSGVRSRLDGLPVVVDICDATAMRLASSLPDRRGLDRIVAELEYRSVRALEHRLQRRGDHVLVASRRDGDAVGWISSMSIVPNGVDSAYWTRRTDERPPDTVVFTGKMSYEPNEDAALRLIEEVMPRVRERRPDARLLVVGTSPTTRLQQAGERAGVEVTGRVPDMRDHLEQATVFAAPIRYGAGIQNKVLEALAMELPVVASDNAAGGLVIGGEMPPVRIADDPGAMADAVVGELDAADVDPAPVRLNRQWVVSRFDWDASARRLHDILSGFVSGSGQDSKR